MACEMRTRDDPFDGLSLLRLIMFEFKTVYMDCQRLTDCEVRYISSCHYLYYKVDADNVIENYENPTQVRASPNAVIDRIDSLMRHQRCEGKRIQLQNSVAYCGCRTF